MNPATFRVCLGCCVVALSAALSMSTSAFDDEGTQVVGTHGRHLFLRLDGIGDVRIGMTADELSKAIGIPVAPSQIGTDEQGKPEYFNETCYAVGDAPSCPDVSFTVYEGRLGRIDVDHRGIATDSGIQVGDPVDQIRAHYGKQAHSKPFLYGGDEFTLVSSESNFLMKFYVRDGIVVEMASGMKPAMDLVEGCE